MYKQAFKKELENPTTNYFILDTKGTNGNTDGDIDFIKYGWQRSKYNKINTGDLFICRRPGKASETGKFYFFGAARMGVITGEDRVVGQIENALPFEEYLNPNDLEGFKWSWKKRGDDWQHFFNQYGMNQIPREDFINLMDMARIEEHPPEIPSLETQVIQEFKNKNYLTGYDLLCRHLMSALHRELAGSSFSDKLSDVGLYQKLDLADGQCIRFTKWYGEKKSDDSRSIKPFYLFLCTEEREASKILQLDMTNIAYNDNHFTWYLKSPRNPENKEFLRTELGDTVQVDEKYRSTIAHVKGQLDLTDNEIVEAHEFLTHASIGELTTQFCRLVKLTFENHSNEDEGGTPKIIDGIDKIENDDMSSFILALRRVRQHQGPFKEGLLKRYSGKCVITGCSINSLLIGAHIKDFSVCGINDLTNGLLLRTDIHTLYDAGLLKVGINQESPKNSLLITLDERIKDSEDYHQYHNKIVTLDSPDLMPGNEYLKWKNNKHK